MSVYRLIHGIEVTSSNKYIDFNRGGVLAATLNEGVYGNVDELCAEVVRALEAADSTPAWACSFSHTTFKFTISTAAHAFTLLWNTGANAASDANGLLGFDAVDQASSANACVGDVAAGTSPSTVNMWVPVDPGRKHTPVTASASGAAMARGKREVRAEQNVTDGGFVETVYFHTLKTVDIDFWALSSSEATNMETFLDWIVKGHRFMWYPDSTATTYVVLCAKDLRQVSLAFEWLARPEITYGTLTFYEQVARV